MEVIANLIWAILSDLAGWFVKVVILSLLKLFRRIIAWKRSRQQSLPEDGYHRPDNSDDTDLTWPKLSRMDRLDRKLKIWIENMEKDVGK